MGNTRPEMTQAGQGRNETATEEGEEGAEEEGPRPREYVAHHKADPVVGNLCRCNLWGRATSESGSPRAGQEERLMWHASGQNITRGVTVE